MDKLEPVIRNRFWILCGLVLPMVLYGYYAANGALKEATAARETELDGVKSGISSGFEPNERFSKGLATINDFYEQSIDEVIVQLWEKQQERMTWPQSVADKVPDEFQGSFDLDTLITYKNQYPFVIRELMYRAEPVLPVKDQDLAKWKQKLILASPVPQASFGTLTPTSQEMWNAQIDVWLVDLLFDAVRRLNQDKDSIANANLRRIDRLELFGGNGSPVLTGGGAGAGGGGGAEGEMGAEYMEMGGGGGGQRGAAAVRSAVPFSPAQEFGPGQEASSGGGGGAEGEMGMMGGGSRAPRIRYIKHSDSDPYMERGFYLSVIIAQNKIPDFLVELANSPWPVRIVRFHVGENPYGDRARVGRGGTGMNPGFDDMDSGGSFSDFETGGVGGFGSGGFGAGRDIGGATGRDGIPAFAQGLPPYATAALQHPDLVQLDLCGVITIYKQPKETIEKLAARAQAAEAQSAAPSAVSDDEAVPSELSTNPEPATPASTPVPEPTPDDASPEPSPPAAAPEPSAPDDSSDASADDNPAAPAAVEEETP